MGGQVGGGWVSWVDPMGLPVVVGLGGHLGLQIVLGVGLERLPPPLGDAGSLLVLGERGGLVIGVAGLLLQPFAADKKDQHTPS